MSTVTINGDRREIGEGMDLMRLIENLELSDTRIAVELNKSVVRRKDWPQTTLSDSDIVEIVHFVGGG